MPEAGPSRFPKLHLRRYRNHSIDKNISVCWIIPINRQSASSFSFQSFVGTKQNFLLSSHSSITGNLESSQFLQIYSFNALIN
jgi:hypothetical protein